MSHFLELKLFRGAWYQVSRTVLYFQRLFVIIITMVVLVEPTQLSAKDTSGMTRIEPNTRFWKEDRIVYTA